MRGKTRTTEHIAATIAFGQHGTLSREQLLEAGVAPSAIDRRLEKGHLIRVHRGVYRVGHTAPSTEATYMAGVLAAGEGALLAGRSAAHLMRLLKGAPPPPEVIAKKERQIKGVRVKRERGLDPRDATVFGGIPTTTVARTLVDLAGCVPEYQLGQACHQAGVLYRTQPEDVEAVLERRPNSKGAKTLREILRGKKKISLSRLERRFLELLKDNNLELPETNRSVGGRYVDCRWPARNLTVELDSYRYHSSRHAWEQDRKRERQARARGDDFRRYTSDDVFEDPRALLKELGPIIGLRAK